MTTINQIASEFQAARAINDIHTRAMNMLAVQRMAAESRSKHAYKIECDAHAFACMALNGYTGEDNNVRSELGRIRAESKMRFAKGGTASRSVVPVL
jgi:hypothetical protein